MIDGVPDNLCLSGWHWGNVWNWGGYYAASKGKQCSDSKDTTGGPHFDLFW